MPRPALLTLLLLAACSSPKPAVVSNPPTPEELACAADANNDPALQEARGISAGTLDWQWQHSQELRQLRQDAITRCLRARGLAPRGGVERAR